MYLKKCLLKIYRNISINYFRSTFDKNKNFFNHKYNLDGYYRVFSLVEWYISDPGFDKSFKWDEWIWFGFVPAIAPFVLYLIWKKEINFVKKTVKKKLQEKKT